MADPRLWSRWLLMFSLALGTTAAWVIFDAAWFARRETPEYRQWARRFSLKLYTVAIVCFAAVGTWYVFLTWTPEVRKAMFAWPWLPLTLATAAAMGLPWLLIYRLQKRAEVGRGLASLLGLVQFAVLGVNAVSRQVVQNLELARYSFDITKQPEAVQWSPLLVFLAAFVLGLAVVAWMISASRKVAGGEQGGMTGERPGTRFLLLPTPTGCARWERMLKKTLLPAPFPRAQPVGLGRTSWVRQRYP